MNWLGHLNRQLPIWSSLKDSEIKGAETLQHYMKMDSIKLLIYNLLIFSFVPSFCEEVFFRGTMQPLWVKSTGSKWLGVLIKIYNIYNNGWMFYQTAVTRVLQPVYEDMFYPSSYGFRPGKSQRQAMEELTRQVSWQGMRYIIDADMQNYFGSINHQCLREFLDRRIKDG